MASTIVITVKSELTQAEVQQRYQQPTGKPKLAALALVELFKAAAGGIKPLNVDVQTGSAAPVAASGTLTLVSAVATDAITIGTITMTATSTPSTNLHWEIDGADDTADAASLAAAINANPTLGAIVTATSDLGVVTVTAKQKGVAGNFIPISSADATITASGAFLAGGTGGVMEAAVNYNLGIT